MTQVTWRGYPRPLSVRKEQTLYLTLYLIQRSTQNSTYVQPANTMASSLHNRHQPPRTTCTALVQHCVVGCTISTDPDAEPGGSVWHAKADRKVPSKAKKRGRVAPL